MYTSSAAPSMVGQWDRDREAEKIPSADKHGQLGKMEFLKLLITQLENQDPLNPMDDKEFVAQLAQFSSLEQMTNIAEDVNAIRENSTVHDLTGAVGFIGREVMAYGYELSKDGSHVSTMYYTLPEAAKKMYINIFDQNGNMVQTVELQGRQAGNYEFKWDGKDYNGNSLADGNYLVYMAAEGLNGEPVMIDSYVSGRVSGVQNFGGEPYLRLTDGRLLKFSEVTEIVGSYDEYEDSDDQESEDN
ncbi:flagellar hook assembly protein FlgD [Desulfonatronovibrio hydrogenovorans]|uniref:flagellar hook assembly protein FlgD n=1 Tax=Desulfonatronovibrio hydrogenovorans TaxID=53245 RepID=UPI000555FC89|nr:flagellar hook capping FlgD N-terminal domain-containing protein [Desulfonatronovibrio hydrogenovorans]